MFESRTLASIAQFKKPRILIDKNFMDLSGLDVGVNGQMSCSVKIVSINKEMDGNGNEILKYEIEINKVNSVLL